MRELSFETIFSMFLKAINFEAPITKSSRGLKAKRGNTTICLNKSLKNIVLKSNNIVFNSGEYEKIQKVFLYKIIEDTGDIKVNDENERTILRLRSDHEILKIESVKKKQPVNNQQFVGSADLLRYREIQKEVSLF